MWIFFFLCPWLFLHARMITLYLSVTDDPTTSMGISWHTTLDQTGDVIVLKNLDGTWEQKVGEHTFENGSLSHKVVLTNLTPDTEYSFRIEEYLKIYTFRTAPTDLDESFSFAVYAQESEFPSIVRRVVEHISRRVDDLFSADQFFFFPPYPPTTLPFGIEETPYPFRGKDPIRNSCEKTRALLQQIYSPYLRPDPLAEQAQTAGSGESEQSLFHADTGTDYGGIDQQKQFDAFHKQAVSLVSQVMQSLSDPKDFSLYAILHGIGLLRLKLSMETGAGDILQLGRWRAKAIQLSLYEDDPDPYLVVAAGTPLSKNTRYHRYHQIIGSIIPPDTEWVETRETLDGCEIPLTVISRNGIRHTSAVYTVTILNNLEMKIQDLLGKEQPKSEFFKALAFVHWWLAQLTPFFRGSASGTEILIQAIAVAKGYPPPRFSGVPSDDKEGGFLFTDLEAMCLPLEPFINQYESMIQRLVR